MFRTRTELAAALFLLLAGCGGSDEDIASRTERLSPRATSCVTTDDCLYGHCTTEDGVCYGYATCPPGASCGGLCYGTCVATPSSRP